MEKNIHNRKYLENWRKKLRNNSTSAEATLWKSLQRKKLMGRKFRRQHSIFNYIVDFYCPSEKLIIELEGAGHFNISQQNYDLERTDKLELVGFKGIRFENKIVFEDIELLLAEIERNFKC